MSTPIQEKALAFNSILIMFGFSLLFGIVNLLKSIGKAIVEYSISYQNLNQTSFFIASVLIDFVFLSLFIILMFLYW